MRVLVGGKMWVRNQSKDKLFNVNFFEIAKFIKDGNYRYDVLESQFSHNDYYIYSQDAGILGVYKSKERAIEVLDEIEAFIENNYISIDDMPSHNNSPYPNYCPTHFTTTTRKKVFKMPKE